MFDPPTDECYRFLRDVAHFPEADAIFFKNLKKKFKTKKKN